MDFDEKRKRQLVRVIIAEIGMVLSVIAIVVVSTLAAMGFVISSNGTIEQSGLMQLHSLPTGASVKIDGNAIFPRTNLSRTLSAGEHSLEIYRDGYDTWSNTIKVYSGVLLRIYYPRLFLQNRTPETVSDLATLNNLEFYSPSNGRNYILFAEKGSSDWQLLDIRGDEVKTTILDLSGILPGMQEDKAAKQTANNAITTYTYKFHGTIDEIKWSGNEENVLVKVTYEDKSDWVLVHLRDLTRSLNLTQTFGLGDTQLEMIDSAANQLYALEKHQLRRINTVDGVMSRVLLNNIESFASYGANVVYLSKDEQGRSIGVYRDDDKGGTIIATQVPDNTKVQLAISNYYSEDYVIYALDQKVQILYGKVPSYSENGADLSTLKPLVESLQLSELPNNFTVSPDGEYIVARKDQKYMVIDLDMGDLYEYEAPAAALKWFDSSMMYAVKDDEIIVWDFDGTNQRNLAKSVIMPEVKNDASSSSDSDIDSDAEKRTQKVNNSPVVVTGNNRWMYYLTNGDKFITLTREKIRE